MDRNFVLGLAVVTLVVIGLVIFFGLKLSRTVQTRAPESGFAVGITPVGSVLFACIVGFWALCAAARVLAPESSLGAFVDRVDGAIAVVIGSTFFAGIAAAILEKLGYPIAKKRGGSGA